MFFVWIPVNMVHVRSDPMLLWFCEILFHSPQSIKSQKFRIGGAYLRTMDGWLLPVTWNELRVWGTGGSKGKGARVHGPLATWASAQNALNVAIFRLKIEKKFLGRGKCPIPRPQLVFLCINHNVVTNTLVLSRRAIFIHTTASFPTSSNGGGVWEGALPLPRKFYDFESENGDF